MIDLIGCVFGRLTVIEVVKVKGQEKRLRCTCECGSEVLALAYNVKNGNTRSCGCMAREARSARGKAVGAELGRMNRKHGQSTTATYASWRDAKARCYNPNVHSYPHYGGRGIGMCERWRNSFEAFLEDMGQKPDGLTLERENNDRDYEPGNCVWATRRDQSQNRPAFNRLNRKTAADVRRRLRAGESVEALAAEFGAARSTIQNVGDGKSWNEE